MHRKSLAYVEIQLRFEDSIIAAGRHDWHQVIRLLTPDLIVYPHPNTQAQACAMAAWAYWMIGDLELCDKTGNSAIEIARSENGYGSSAGARELRYWVSEAVSPALAVRRTNLEFDADQQREAIEIIFGQLEYAAEGRLPLGLQAVQLAEHACALLSERRAVAWHLRVLEELAIAASDDYLEMAKIEECRQKVSAIAEIVLSYSPGLNPHAGLFRHPYLRTLTDAWRAAVCTVVPRGLVERLPPGGLTGLLASWLGALQTGRWRTPETLPLAWMAATLCWAAPRGLLEAVQEQVPGTLLLEKKALLSRRLGKTLSKALLAWGQHPNANTADALRASCRGEPWACLLV